ncbi:MAG: hypothetical protein DI587_16565 [Variovorax paradoxus]|nr:hypothetical protein ASF45_16840 [Pseudorhodoferax sp. Leaf265]PZP97843.1 MAG: hypothetical protein DI583_16565 [Variovorax paradoxus]PZQ09137.1 MAG: hypothetical protein DI587_16565 [Variovorax paradoxus]
MRIARSAAMLWHPFQEVSLPAESQSRIPRLTLFQRRLCKQLGMPPLQVARLTRTDVRIPTRPS